MSQGNCLTVVQDAVAHFLFVSHNAYCINVMLILEMSSAGLDSHCSPGRVRTDDKWMCILVRVWSLRW